MWRSKDVSKERIKAPVTSNHSLKSTLDYTCNPKIQINFDGDFLK